ncbi:cell division protein FtsQ/DivIB [Kineococcus rhizosphaerae]|uniref:cell division protein FtsQ/DivIB n=1 Tax=Kineococcus rhizosphaerae TaxID=559628 RepID=UPI0014746D60|nr:FtsQ-type POTRA domain-containing protein [Kineococcus rhizosphaerae]
MTPPEPKVTGTPQRRRAVRAAGDPLPRPQRPQGPHRAPRARPATTPRPAGRPPVADLAGARRARRWRPGRRAAAVLAALAVLVAATGWLLLASPWLRVTTIRTSGLERTDSAAVQRVVDREEGVPLARVGTRSLASQLEALPLVESVDVSRSWPSTLVVSVHERQAVAAVPSTAGGVDLVDGHGNVLVHEDRAPSGVPTLDVDVASAGAAALQAAIAVNATLSTQVRAEVSSISATGPDAVTLHLAEGPTVVWGDDSRPERKAEVLVRMLADAQVASAKSLDVSAPDAPAVTP